MTAHFSKRVYTERSRSGFTLVELLVVISIITILATIGLATYGAAQKQARISKRIKDLAAIQTALELYHSTNKAYPCSGTCASPVARSECGVTGVPSDQVVPGLIPKYMVVFPSDPSMDTANNKSCYKYMSDGIDYKVQDFDVAEMSVSDYKSQQNLVDPARDGGINCSKIETGGTVTAWAVYSYNTGLDVPASNPACWL